MITDNNSNISKSYLCTALAVLLVSLQGCSEQAENAMNLTQEAGESANIKQAAAKNPGANKGTVISVLNSGGYSYIEVDINGEAYWIATGISDISAGEIITWNGHVIMSNFQSKSLNRVFDQILFVDRVLPESSMVSKKQQGTVIEIMDAAGYSYIHVDVKGKKIWLAAPTTKLDQGQIIQWNSGEPMQNFSSKSLQRNFEEIFFVSRVEI